MRQPARRRRTTSGGALLAVSVVAGSLAVAGHGPAIADHCPDGYQSDVDGEHSCSGSISDLFPEDGTSPDEPGDAGDATTEPPVATPSTAAPTTTTTSEPDDDLDVGAAILDALDDRLADEVFGSPALLEAIGCDTVVKQCPALARAVDAADGFVDLAFAASRAGESAHRQRVHVAVATAAVAGALVDEDGELLFPTLMAAMPVLTQLALLALDGDASDLETLVTFHRLLLSFDARARGFLE